jgi:hypothetical protein
VEETDRLTSREKERHMADKEVANQEENAEDEVVGQAQATGDPTTPALEVSESRDREEEGEDDPKMIAL